MINAPAALLLICLGAAPAAATPPPASGTAVSRAAAEVALQVAAARPEGPVAVLVSAQTPELSRGFFALLAGELQQRALSALPLTASPATAETEAREAGAGTLLRLLISVDRGLLSVRGDLYRVRPNFWAGQSSARQGAGAAIAASTEADAHALALAAPLLDPQGSTHQPLRLVHTPLSRLPVPTAALAAGDLDNDGRDELVLLTDQELLVLGPTGALVARRPLRELSRAASRSREPFGTVAVVRGTPGRIGYFSGQHGRGEWLTLEGRLLRVQAQVTTPLLVSEGRALEGSWVPGTHRFTAPAEANLPLEQVVHLTSYTTAAGPQFLGVLPDGSGYWAGLEGITAPVPLVALGAASTLVDLDGDGRPELATTSTEYAPAPDFVRLTDAAQTVLWEVPVERGRLLQLVPADLDGDRTPELVAAAWLPDGSSELRVLRKVAP